jgi:hypothetical protein
LAGRQIL